MAEPRSRPLTCVRIYLVPRSLQDRVAALGARRVLATTAGRAGIALLGATRKHPGKGVSRHDSRNAAFLRAAEVGIHSKRAAVAFDVTPETKLSYCTSIEKKRTGDEVLAEL